MKRSEINPMPEYFDRYINMVDDVSYMEALNTSLAELDKLPVAKLAALEDKVYAPGKWTIRDIFQHMIDAERVFSYRVMAFSRSEPGKVLSFDEELYAKNAQANFRELEDIINELKIVRQAYIELYKSFTKEMLLKTGMGFRGEYSVLAMGFMIPGHQRWHLKIVEEKYFPLLNK